MSSEAVLLCITGTRSLVFRRGDVEAVAQGEGDTTRIGVLHLAKHEAIAVERKAVDGTIEKVIA